ncbi:hypothetical protein ACFX1T_040451 [Malus domestica]
MLLSLPKVYKHLRCIHELSRPHADGRDISVRLKHYRELSRNRQRGRAFFKNLRKDVPSDIDSIYLNKLFNEVNEYQRNILHVQWADFRFKYFESPWSFLSALAALILLILTTIQAFFAVHGYLRPPISG